MAAHKALCKYFVSNCCTRGDSCRFSHSLKDKPDMTCRYYQMGACVYGNKCRYNHVRHKETVRSDSSRISRDSSDTIRTKMPGPITLAVAAGLATSSNMVTLKQDPTRKPSEWVKAPEFIPGRSFHGTVDAKPPPPQLIMADENDEYFFSYSDATMSGLPSVMDEISSEEASSLLCPFFEMTGQCPWEEKCEYVHGQLCDMCQKYCLHPEDHAQQKEHKASCEKVIEEDMERAFAVQRSQGQTCGICMDVVLEKKIRSDRRFGILSGCDHCFCLGCIRKWRNSTHSNKKTIRACPLCRTVSYLVIPSEVWIVDPEEKQKLLGGYKDNLYKKPCKYFNEGEGTCPFGSSCLYKHALPDGSRVESLPRVAADDKGRTKVVGTSMLWDFIDQRDEQQWVEENWDNSDDEDED